MVGNCCQACWRTSSVTSVTTSHSRSWPVRVVLAASEWPEGYTYPIAKVWWQVGGRRFPGRGGGRSLMGPEPPGEPGAAVSGPHVPNLAGALPPAHHQHCRGILEVEPDPSPAGPAPALR